MNKAVVLLVTAFFITGCASTGIKEGGDGHQDEHQYIEKGGRKFTKHLPESQILVTEKGRFSVEMAIPGNRLVVGSNTFDLVIHEERDRDVTNAEIVVTLWMPGMEGGSFTSPKVIEKGNGLYTVEDVILAMGGHWQIGVRINWADEEDKVVFDFPYVSAAAKQSYLKAKTPAGDEIVLGSRNPLKELNPGIVEENGQTIKVFRLTVKDVGYEIFPGKSLMGWGFNGIIPGPTIRVKEGDRVRVILENDSSGEHTFHVHGQRKSMEADGVPYIGQQPVKKGDSYVYEFTADNIGTNWYHCHVDSAHHVDMGMFGAFIVDPKKEKLEYDREYIMILDEIPTKHAHVHEGQMQMPGHGDHGVMTIHEGVEPEHKHPGGTPSKRDWYPKTYLPHNDVYDGFTINGRSFPFTEPIFVRKGEKIRIRFINVGYQSHFMHTHSHRFRVVARDGSYVDEPQLIDTVGIGPAKRVDIILEADNPGIWPFHCHSLNHVTNEHIYPGGMMTFIVYEDSVKVREE